MRRGIAFARPTAKENVDQLRKLVAVAAFKDCSRRDRALAQPLTEEGEIFLFETHLSDWIARESIEAG